MTFLNGVLSPRLLPMQRLIRKLSECGPDADVQKQFSPRVKRRSTLHPKMNAPPRLTHSGSTMADTDGAEASPKVLEQDAPQLGALQVCMHQLPLKQCPLSTRAFA